ncbi:MAG TPA: helix-turn-helix domain-containing protein [Vicinamibacteria bacterium]
MASFGETLRRERELRGIGLREMADATKISVRFLQALEEDRVEVLPGGLFPRAFVRQYASFLGLDAERTVAEFLFAHGESVGPPPRALAVPPRPGRVRLLALGAAAAAAAGFLVVRQLREPAPPAPSPAAASSLAPAVSLPTDRVYPAPAAPAPSVMPHPAAAAPAAAGDTALVLAILARQSSWVSIEVDGVKVLARELAEGETQTVKAKKEIVLSVGNAGGVAIELNGRPGLALGREGQVRRNIVITPQNLPSLVQAQQAAGDPRS